MSPEPLIQFLHIPKTGGLTVAHSVLRRLYKRGEALNTAFNTAWRDEARAVGVRDDEWDTPGLFSGMRRPDLIWYPESLPQAARRYLDLDEEQRARVRVYVGFHIEYGLEAYLPGPVSTFTILREPVDRALSHYYFTAEERRPPGDPRLAAHLAECVEPNLQTRLLAGPQDPDHPLEPAEMLAQARENLRACAVAGLTERFDESMLLLRRAYGWRWPLYERKNVSRKRHPRDAIPPETLRRIAQDNRLDVALYAAARELFVERLARYGPTLRRDLAWYRTLNWIYQRVQKVRWWAVDAARTFDRRVIAPPYEALARWGGLRRAWPARWAPRVRASVENDLLYFDLRLGRRIVGSYDPHAGRWDIRRPYHLLVDESALPGATQT